MIRKTTLISNLLGRLPDITASPVYISDLMANRDEGTPFREFPCPIELGLDDKLALAINVAPATAIVLTLINFYRGKSFREKPGNLKLRSDDYICLPVDEAVLVVAPKSRQSFKERIDVIEVLITLVRLRLRVAPSFYINIKFVNHHPVIHADVFTDRRASLIKILDRTIVNRLEHPIPCFINKPPLVFPDSVNKTPFVILVIDADACNAFGEASGFVKPRLNDHRASRINVAPLILDHNERASLIETQRPIKLQGDDNISRFIDVPPLASNLDRG